MNMKLDEVGMVMIAASEGRCIQLRGTTNDRWSDCVQFQHALNALIDNIKNGEVYRIKPEPPKKVEKRMEIVAVGGFWTTKGDHSVWASSATSLVDFLRYESADGTHYRAWSDIMAEGKPEGSCAVIKERERDEDVF